MTLRTPRRRISPRAKRKYRLVRDFFRRALGGSSQQDIKINSSIAVNVTDLKHKLVGIEHQLNKVSRHCHDAGLEDKFPSSRVRYEPEASQSQSFEAPETSPSTATRIVYKLSSTRTKKSDESDYVSTQKYPSVESRKNMTLPTNIGDERYRACFVKVKKKKNRLERARTAHTYEPIQESHRSQSDDDNRAEYAGLDRDKSLVDAELRRVKKHHERRDAIDLVSIDKPRHISHRDLATDQLDNLERYYREKQSRSRKHRCKPAQAKVDDDYIAEIIKKQYRPRKMFGMRHSDISQFSAPVCRDHEFTLREDLMESPDLCSCCYDMDPSGRPPARRHRCEVSDIRSICDTRLYSNKRAHGRHRRHHLDHFNDSAFYDVVPVKEKSSPKSRRKFAEEEALACDSYKEVPPSPRTRRPRLNLRAQHFADDDCTAPRRHNRMSLLSRHRRRSDDSYALDSDGTSEISLNRHRKPKMKLKPVKVQTSCHVQQNGATSSLPSPTVVEHGNLSINDNSMNKSNDTDGSCKTDKALSEIKDILQSFLMEIKKESTTRCEKSEVQNHSAPQPSAPELDQDVMAGAQAACAPSAPYSNYNVPQCPLQTGFMPQFTNPCCYPMLSMYPMNCIPSTYMVPSPSCTCHACTSSKDTTCQCSKQKESNDAVGGKNTETEELIKEIYKFVAEKPTAWKKRGDHKREGTKILTSRSVGGSSRMSKHDANVGTPTLKCYSKSCEAIGSRMIADAFYTASHSDTVLEKLSLQVTTQSDSDLSTIYSQYKTKKSKFASVLRSIGLLKKKKRKHISETESSIEVDVKPRRSSPFRQDTLDYAVHGQEFFHPPSPMVHSRHDPRCDHQHDSRHYPHYDPRRNPGVDPRYSRQPDRYENIPTQPGCEHRGPYYTPRIPSPSHPYSAQHVHKQTIPEYGAPDYPLTPPPPFSHHFNPHYGHDPHVPLCLKEVEVKSTGTQSERKMSFFGKIGRKPTPPTVKYEVPQPRPTLATAGVQTAPQLKPKPVELPKPALFSGWKKFQEKVVADINEDPIAYGYRTNKQLAAGDQKMRKALLKKMFYKRNPFSPNNLIIRTLLGNDPSSFGVPKAAKVRTKLFI